MEEHCAQMSDEKAEHGSGTQCDDVEPIEALREDVKWDTMKTKNHWNAEVPRSKKEPEESLQSRRK